MKKAASRKLLWEEIAEGRTDLVFDYFAKGPAPQRTNQKGLSLLQWCAYYGDVSAIRFLLANGATLAALGDNFDLNGACFHGHWRLCQFLCERGANVNQALADTGETPLHASLCSSERLARNLVMKILLAYGADPHAVTKKGAETGGFMRDCRTKGETALHRAAAFGDEESIQLLLAAGAALDVKDMNGDSPLSWASWYLRPAPILRLLCYGDFYIRPDYGAGMTANLLGRPTIQEAKSPASRRSARGARGR